MNRENIKVEHRSITGKQTRTLRQDGVLPANIYGKNIASTAVQLPISSFQELYKKVHETGLVDLMLDDKKIPVLIYKVQYNPLTREPIHADFFKVNLKEKITTAIPVIATGEAPAVANNTGMLLQQVDTLEIEALPSDLPERIEVSIEDLNEIGDHITVEQLTPPSGVTIKNEPTQTIFAVGELVSKEAEAQEALEAAEAAEQAESTEGETETKSEAGSGGETVEKSEEPPAEKPTE